MQCKINAVELSVKVFLIVNNINIIKNSINDSLVLK